MTNALSVLDADEVQSCESDCDAACLTVRPSPPMPPHPCAQRELLRSIPSEDSSLLRNTWQSFAIRASSSASTRVMPRAFSRSREARASQLCTTGCYWFHGASCDSPARRSLQGALGEVPKGLDATEPSVHHFLAELACFARSVGDKGSAAKGLITGAGRFPRRAGRPARPLGSGGDKSGCSPDAFLCVSVARSAAFGDARRGRGARERRNRR